MLIDEQEIFNYFNTLNADKSHYTSSNDICTPMGCVKEMVDAIPQELWERKSLKVLDCSAGNGNYPAYICCKTSLSNIYFNEINPKRVDNIKKYFGENIHLTEMDFLQYPVQEKYDLIISNPPFARLMDDGTRTAKNHSLSRDFVMKAIELVADGGYLSFILPNNWMSYADRNKIPETLSQYQFLAINIGECKKWFPKVGSSFTWFLLQKVPNTQETIVYNGYKKNDVVHTHINIGSRYIPLYYNSIVASIFSKTIDADNEKFIVETSSDLHKYTKKSLLNLTQDVAHPYRLIHTPNQMVWSSRPHKYQEGWKVFLPTTTTYEPFIDNCGMTQSIAFIRCSSQKEAENIKEELNNELYHFLILLTRYGNFNNERIMQRLPRLSQVSLAPKEKDFIHSFLYPNT